MHWEQIGALMGMVAAVALVLCLAYFFTRYFAVKGLGGIGGVRSWGRESKLRLLDRMPLGREQYLAVVQAGKTCFLLGVTGTQVTLLRELNAEEAALWLAEAEETPNGELSSPIHFQDALKEVLKQRKK